MQVSPVASVKRILPSESLSEAYTEVALVATHISCALFEQAAIRIPIAMVTVGKGFLMSGLSNRTAVLSLAWNGINH